MQDPGPEYTDPEIAWVTTTFKLRGATPGLCARSCDLDATAASGSLSAEIPIETLKGISFACMLLLSRNKN
jgi:hypothetical protein